MSAGGMNSGFTTGLNAAMPVPVDVRLMNMTASLLVLGFLLACATLLVTWVLRQPLFAFQGIVVQGDVAHHDALTLRANVAPRLAGTFFTLDLARARQVFETQPWVRKAVVRREFPNLLRVTLEAHQAMGYWGPESESRLINRFGEVFEANLDEIETTELPRFIGPEGQGPQVLAMHAALKPMFDRLELTIEQLEQSGRGGWSLRLDSGATLDLGRGSAEELVPRVQRFLKTLTQVTSKYGRTFQSLETADLRYPEGYAVRLRGVTTGLAAPTQK